MENRRCFGCMGPMDQAVCPVCGWSENDDNDAHQLKVGTVLREQYIVGKVLGQGGFGITYLGWDRELERVVAIKEFYPRSTVYRDVSQGTAVHVSAADMEPHYANGKDRFLREANALAKLTEVPEIVGIYACFRENNTAYIVMEYIKGATLAQYVQRAGGRLSVEETFRILKPVMEALDTVHRAGLVHRDISPDNMMLHPTGGAKLLDFGAVRAVENLDAGKDLAKSTEAIIKQGFAPIEQYRNRGGIGPWTDEYALCGTIYYCLTGQVPPDALSRSMGEEHPQWENIPGLTDRQRAALEKGMAVSAKDRFPSVAELIEALYSPVGETDPRKNAPEKPIARMTSQEKKSEDPSPAGNKKQKRFPKWIAVGTAALLLTFAAVWGILGRKEVQPATDAPQEAQISTAESMPATVDPVPAETESAPAEPEPADGATDSQTWEANVLMEDPLSALGSTRNTIKTVTFLDTLKDAPEGAVDISLDGDGKVLGWVSGSDVYIAAEDGINARVCCKELFKDCTELITISFGDAFHTEQTEKMDSMFANCGKLQILDVNRWDVSSVTTMENMFSQCTSLQTLYTNRWNVSRVTNMEGLFAVCRSLQTLDVSNWDVSSVTGMNRMFIACEKLQTLDVSNWDVSSVTGMNAMFSGCEELQTLDVSNWDVSSVVDMGCLFYGCGNLQRLDVRNWDISSVSDMGCLFCGCGSLQRLDVGNWDVSSVSNMSAMFASCESLRTLDVSKWDVSSVTNTSSMFYCCKNLEALDVQNWDVSSVEYMTSMFYSCGKLYSIYVGNWDVSRVKNWDLFMDAGRTINGEAWEAFFRR